MKNWKLYALCLLFIFLPAMQCRSHCVDTAARHCATGGTTATGGDVATGGSVAIGGALATGGKAPTGGGTAVAVECSNFIDSNSHTPLNQLGGSCTGHSNVDMISAWPFPGLVHYNEPDAQLAYQGGTCVDNKCSLPCTSASCPKAYNPTTGANDVGSYGSSVADWMVRSGWLKGYVAADTVDDLLVGLKHSACVIDITYLNSMWVPLASGQLKVTLSSGAAGGHSMMGEGRFSADPNCPAIDLPTADSPSQAAYTAANHPKMHPRRHRVRGRALAATAVYGALTGSAITRVYVKNSWGNWGKCFAAQMTPTTPIDGTGCGHAWIAVSDLPKLDFDADCPLLN